MNKLIFLCAFFITIPLMGASKSVTIQNKIPINRYTSPGGALGSYISYTAHDGRFSTIAIHFFEIGKYTANTHDDELRQFVTLVSSPQLIYEYLEKAWNAEQELLENESEILNNTY